MKAVHLAITDNINQIIIHKLLRINLVSSITFTMKTLSTTIQSLGFVSCNALHLHRCRRMNEVLGDVSGGDQSGGRRRKNPAQQDGYRDRETIEELKIKFKKVKLLSTFFKILQQSFCYILFHK
jgi:hypothetical protein